MSLSLDDENAQPEQRQQERFAAFATMLREGRSFSGHERNCCYLNPGDSPVAGNRFANISAASGIDFPDDARALALVDWDQDGDLDLWISNRNAPRLRFLRNEIPQKDSFVLLQLIGNGTATNRDAIGARVELVLETPKDETGASTATNHFKSIQTLRAGEGFLAQNSKWLHFGLGADNRIKKAIVDWPGGKREEFSGLAINSRNVLAQGTGQSQKPDSSPRNIALTAGEQPTVIDSQTATLRLINPVAMPVMQYQSWEGDDRNIETTPGRPLLLSLWASWCQPCLHELAEMTKQSDKLRAAGLQVVALSVDGVGEDKSDPALSKRVLDSMEFPFESGRATKRLLHGLQQMHDRQSAVRRPLPLPTSFLIDTTGQLISIYKGPIDVEEILDDLKHADESTIERVSHAAAIPGRVLQHPTAREILAISEAEHRFKTADLFQKNHLWKPALAQYDDILNLWPDWNPDDSQIARGGNGRNRQMEKRRQIYTMAYSSRGHVHEQVGKLEAAVADYNKAIELMPTDTVLYDNRSLLYSKLRQYDLALKDCNRSIELNPDRAASYFRRATIYQNMQQFQLAVDDTTKGIELGLESSIAHKRRGDLYKQLGKNSLAIADYSRAIKLNPNDRFAHKQRANILAGLQKYSAALADYSEAIDLNPKDAEAYNNRGQIYVALGQFALAQNDFATSIRLQPENPAAYNNLAWLLATCSNPEYRDGEKALSYAKQACELLEWKSAEALDTLAAAAAEAGQFANAIKWQNKALELATPKAKAELRTRLELYQAGRPCRTEKDNLNERSPANRSGTE